MLFLFDVDGTLIESFLREVTCPSFVCRNGQVWTNPVEGWVNCPVCRGTGKKLVHAEQTYDEVIWLPGRLRRLAEIRRYGHSIGLVSNQTGVSLGYQTRKQVDAKFERIVREISNEMRSWSGHVPGVHAWVEYDVKAVNRRKPAPKMLQEAMQHHGIPPWATVFVGDLPVDQEAARRAGAAFTWANDFFDITD